MFEDLKNKFRREGNTEPDVDDTKTLEADKVLNEGADPVSPPLEVSAEAPAPADIMEAERLDSQDVVLPMDETVPADSTGDPEEFPKLESAPGTASQLSFNEQVVERIATLTLHEVKGVLAASGGGGFFNLKNSKGVEIEINPEQDVTVNMEVILEYGRSAPEIFEELKRTVSDQIRQMTGLLVRAVNVRVVNILTKEEFEGKA